jgi:polysaccharide export outer membrane protein
MIHYLRFTAMALCALLVAGCTTVPRGVDSRFAETLTAAYTLDSGDQLRVIVFGQANLTNSYTVDDSGQIAMPLIGSVAARGRTTQQVEGDVRSQLASRYLRDPKVTIEVETYRPFFVLGEVNSAGQFAYVRGMTGRAAAAVAGGFTPRARQNTMVVTRMVDGTLVTAEVPINHPVLPGDTVTIQERWF